MTRRILNTRSGSAQSRFAHRVQARFYKIGASVWSPRPKQICPITPRLDVEVRIQRRHGARLQGSDGNLRLVSNRVIALFQAPKQPKQPMSLGVGVTGEGAEVKVMPSCHSGMEIRHASRATLGEAAGSDNPDVGFRLSPSRVWGSLCSFLASFSSKAVPRSALRIRSPCDLSGEPLN